MGDHVDDAALDRSGNAPAPRQQDILDALWMSYLHLPRKKQASRVMEAEGSQITAGRPGEPVLFQGDVEGVHIRRLPDDPLALRISIGESHELPESTYFVFRGDPGQILALLELCVVALRHADAG